MLESLHIHVGGSFVACFHTPFSMKLHLLAHMSDISGAECVQSCYGADARGVVNDGFFHTICDGLHSYNLVRMLSKGCNVRWKYGGVKTN